MQLIRITSTPIKYDINIQPAELRIAQNSDISHTERRTSGELKIDAKPVQIRMDSTELFASLGVKSAPRLIKEAAQKGLQAAQKATAQYAEFGNQLTEINRGVDVSSIIKQRMLEQPDLQTVFLPSAGTDISWDPNSISIKYNPGTLTMDWHLQRNVMDYIPGKFELNIVQYPKITIEYLGEPSYVPPSANPNFDGDAGD